MNDPDFVRPYVVTGGRTAVDRNDLRVETMVERTDGAEPPPATSSPEADRLLACCTSPQSIAELSAITRLPLGVVRVLVGDLTDAGLLAIHHTDPLEIQLAALDRMIEKVRSL